MLKKFISILLIVLLAMCSVGSVAAEHFYGDFGVEVGDVFTDYDCHRLLPNDHFTVFEMLGAIEESGLCKELEMYVDFYGFLHWKHLAEKVGSYTYTVVPFWGGDDDYLTFHVDPHPMEICSDSVPCIGPENNLQGSVYPRAANPDKSKPGSSEFDDSEYLITLYPDLTEDIDYAKRTTVKTHGNNGAYNLYDLHWDLRPNSTYVLSVGLFGKGNWSTVYNKWIINT